MSQSIVHDPEPPSTWQAAISGVDPPPPTASASPGLVAYWIRDGEVCLGEEFTAESVRRCCALRHVDPDMVLAALKELREETPAAYAPKRLVVTENFDSWEELRAYRDVVRCPFPRWSISSTTGRQYYGFQACDDALRCPEHAHRRANRILANAWEEWRKLDTVYWAKVVDDGKVIDRVRSTGRAGRKNADSWWVKRQAYDGWKEVTVVTLWASLDLAGPRTTKPPLAWEPLMPEEALERLVYALRLPGVGRYSPQWAHHSEAESVPKAEGRGEKWLALPSVWPQIQGEVIDLAARMAEERWGFRPSSDYFPADRAPIEEWAAIIRDATNAVRMKREVAQGEEP